MHFSNYTGTNTAIDGLTTMTGSAKKIIEQALELGVEERAMEAEQLLLSLSGSRPEINEAWLKECDARLAAYQRGEAKAVSMQEVFAKYKTE